MNKSRPYTVPNDVLLLPLWAKNTAYFKLFPLLEKNASDGTGASMSCFSFSPHKLLDMRLTASIYIG